MGVLKKKVTEPAPVEPTKFKKMPDEEVYTVLETSLMEAQYALSQYRKMGPSDRGVVLAWLNAEITTAKTACQEFISRNT